MGGGEVLELTEVEFLKDFFRERTGIFSNKKKLNTNDKYKQMV